MRGAPRGPGLRQIGRSIRTTACVPFPGPVHPALQVPSPSANSGAAVRRFPSPSVSRSIPRAAPLIPAAESCPPAPISMPREQCSSACAGLIVPHCRALSGFICAIRCFTSSALAASNRFFIRKSLPYQTPQNQSVHFPCSAASLTYSRHFTSATPAFTAAARNPLSSVASGRFSFNAKSMYIAS